MICRLATNMNRATKERGTHKDDLSVGYQHEELQRRKVHTKMICWLGTNTELQRREVHTKMICRLGTNTNRVTKERGTHKDDLSVELQRWDV